MALTLITAVQFCGANSMQFQIMCQSVCGHIKVLKRLGEEESLSSCKHTLAAAAAFAAAALASI